MDIQKRKMLRIIGQNIRMWRREAGFGLRELAESIGISSKTLNHYEAGRVDIPLSKLLAICKRLGITPEKIMGGVENDKQFEREVISTSSRSDS